MRFPPLPSSGVLWWRDQITLSLLPLHRVWTASWPQRVNDFLHSFTPCLFIKNISPCPQLFFTVHIFFFSWLLIGRWGEAGAADGAWYPRRHKSGSWEDWTHDCWGSDGDPEVRIGEFLWFLQSQTSRAENQRWCSNGKSPWPSFLLRSCW